MPGAGKDAFEGELTNITFPDVPLAPKQSMFADIISILCSPRPGLACPSKVLFTVACIVLGEAACVIRIAKVMIASHAQYSSTGRNLKCWPWLVSFFVIAVKRGGSNGAELTGSIGSIRLNGETCAGQIISSSCNMSCCRCGKRLNFSSNFPDSTSNSALESLIRQCSLIWVFVRTMSSPRPLISMTCSAILAADLPFQTPSTESN